LNLGEPLTETALRLTLNLIPLTLTLTLTLTGTFCFDNIILIFIALNSILTAMADYENVDDDGNPEPNGSARNTIIYVSEFIFLVVYTGEFLIKIIAFGFAWGNDNVYLKDPWNVLDFITVIASYLALDPTLPNLSAIRTFRAFRPLRSVNRFPGLKRLVTALLDSLVGLVDVVLLLLFLLLIYSILGMQLFQGLQHARCRVVPHPVIVPSDCTDVTNECWGQYLDMLTTVNATTSDYNYNHPAYICLTKDDGVTPEDNFDLDWTKDSSPWNVGGLDCVWPEDADDERVCSLPNNNLNGDYTCPSQRWCGSNYDDQGNRRFKEVDYPYGFNRMNSGTYVAGLNFGITNFDNIFSALLSCFQAVTMEGWTDIMYQIQDGVNGPIGSIFFVSLIVIGSFVMLSLVLAVVEEQVASPLVPVKTEEQIQKEKEDATVRRNRRTASMAEMAVLKKRLSTAKIHTSPKGKREELAEVAEVAESAESADAEGEDGEKPPTLGTKRSMSKLQIAAKIVALNETTTKSTRLSIVTAETLADEPALRMWVITIIGSDLFANFMNLVILVNTIVLAMDKYPVDEDEEATLDVVNMVLTFIFIIEFAMMIYGLGPKGYCADRFNIFDGFIVLVSILELLIGLFDKPKGGGGGGISALRSFRLFRVLKLARDWQSLQDLLTVFGKTVIELGNFFVLLALFMFIYALLGMQFMANRFRYNAETEAALDIPEGPEIGDITSLYYEPGDYYRPRAHFDSLEWALTTIFQILTGENWNTVMYDGWRSTQGWGTSFYFITLVWFGQLIMMSLFMALLLCNFEDDEEEEEEEEQGDEKNKMMKTMKSLMGSLRDPKKEGISETMAQIDAEEDAKDEAETKANDEEGEEEDDAVDPASFRSCGVFAHDNPVRVFATRIVNDPYFDPVVVALIVLSSIALAVDDPLKDKDSVQQQTIGALDIIFTILFTIEMLLKITSMGFALHKGAYLRDSWNILDFIVVIISLVNVASIGGDSGPAASLRVLRALRPLRMISRAPELKLIVDALVLSVPGMLNIVFICGLFLLIFAIFGISYLKGVFYACQGDDYFALPQEARDLVIYPPSSWEDMSVSEQAYFNGTTCEGNIVEDSYLEKVTSKYMCECLLGEDAWDETVSQNFNNVGEAMSLLYEISSTEGWVDVMYAAVDNRGMEMQPVENSALEWIAFFILFMFVGWAFVMNLFVGQLISSFNALSRKGVKLRSEAQEEWAKTQKLVLQATPQRLHRKPTNPIRKMCFAVAESPYQEPFIMSCIVLNCIVLAMAWFEAQDDAYVNALQAVNFVFAMIFTLEAIVKIIAYTFMGYIYETWNIFDFTIVVGTAIGIILQAGAGISVGPVASVIRMFRVGRVFRLINSAKNLRKLFNTLISAVPVCGNVLSVVCLIFFIAAVAGVQLFARVMPDGDDITERANFQTFGTALLTLIRFSTGENWNGFMYSLASDREGCVEDPPACDEPRCEPTMCGSAAARPYFYLFTLIVTFVIINLLIAVVLDAFDENDESEIIDPEAIQAFVAAWKREEFDPMATGFIELEKLGPFVQILDAPMGFGEEYEASDKELEEKIRGLDINIFSERGFAFYDVLTAVTKRVTAGVLEERGEQFEDLPDSHHVVKVKLRKIGVQSLEAASSLRDRLDVRIFPRQEQTPQLGLDRVEEDARQGASSMGAPSPPAPAATAGKPEGD